MASSGSRMTRELSQVGLVNRQQFLQISAELEILTSKILSYEMKSSDIISVIKADLIILEMSYNYLLRQLNLLIKRDDSVLLNDYERTHFKQLDYIDYKKSVQMEQATLERKDAIVRDCISSYYTAIEKRIDELVNLDTVERFKSQTLEFIAVMDANTLAGNFYAHPGVVEMAIENISQHLILFKYEIETIRRLGESYSVNLLPECEKNQIHEFQQKVFSAAIDKRYAAVAQHKKDREAEALMPAKAKVLENFCLEVRKEVNDFIQTLKLNPSKQVFTYGNEFSDVEKKELQRLDALIKSLPQAVQADISERFEKAMDEVKVLRSSSIVYKASKYRHEKSLFALSLEPSIHQDHEKGDISTNLRDTQIIKDAVVLKFN